MKVMWQMYMHVTSENWVRVWVTVISLHFNKFCDASELKRKNNDYESIIITDSATPILGMQPTDNFVHVLMNKYFSCSIVCNSKNLKTS